MVETLTVQCANVGGPASARHVGRRERNPSPAHRAAAPTVRLPEQRAGFVAGARRVRRGHRHAGMVVAGLLPHPNFEKTPLVESVTVFVFP